MLFELNDKILEGKSRILVVGDLHGDFKAYHDVMEEANLDDDVVIFLGDYADRGKQGVEIIEHLHHMLQQYPRSVVALMGNHELYSKDGRPLFRPCDLIDEAERKRGSWNEFFKGTFSPFMSKLYLTAILPGKALFIHAGITNGVTSKEILEKPDASLKNDLLWSDAVDGDFYESPNIMRGTGKLFGRCLTITVCERLDVETILRSHEPRKAMNGPCYQHDGRVITISSTNAYGGRPHVLELDNLGNVRNMLFL